MRERVAVLMAAAGAGWEVDALRQLSAESARAVLLKRCVDLNDLLASAATGQGQVAVLAAGLPGLDASSIDHLRRSGLASILVVGPDPEESAVSERGRSLGVTEVLPRDGLDRLVDLVVAAAAEPVATMPVEPEPTGAAVPTAEVNSCVAGRLVAVWGPTGAPGRTTVAVGLAAEIAHRGTDTFLVDVDGYGGTVAQHLGVLEEVSGLLSAARLANAGQLDQERLASLARSVGPALRVLTGLPRADRWVEVRESAFTATLDVARVLAPVVVADVGFCLETDPGAGFGGAPGRNQMAVSALEQADELVVVGSADPVGLARLARGLVELLAVVPGATTRIVVNRTRPSLGWGEREVRSMIEGFVTPASVHFLPEDRTAADQALMSGRSLVELGDSPLRRGLAGVADAVLGSDAGSVVRRRPRSPVGRRRG